MWNEDDRKWLYDKMQKAGVETGTYDEFTSSMDNDEDRDWYYQKAKGMNLDLGSADDFRAMMATPKESQPAVSPAVNTPAHDTAQAAMAQQPMQAAMPQTTEKPQPVQEPQQMMNTSQLDPKYQLNEDGSVKPWNMLETERTLDDQGNTVNKPKLVKGADGTDVYRNAMTGEEYNPLSPEGMEMAGQNTSIVPTDLKKANREQVANLSADIDNAFAEYNKNNVSALSLGTYYGGTAGMNATNDKEWQTLSAAKHSMDDAKKMIEAADANAKNGTLGEWLNSSFAGGAARGFGEKLFDVRTWDMGLTDATENKALYDALQKADNGNDLTKGEQMLLDAKAVELATNAYFGSYVGRGYKAGEVTAESLPFMLEMCINPASAAGETAQSMLARYAMKRLGNKVAAKAVGMAGRAAADLGASAVMSATSGSGRVAADTFDRMNGTVQYDTDENGQSIFAGHTDGEDFATALGKAFGSTTIENYSEMVGEYFAPVLGFARQGATAGLEKIGLGKVNDFIEQVGASDLAKMVTDFEKNAKWSGLFSEYAEEVTGNIMNALTVGDMTLDTAEGTGVFNLDQNIDTFLGTALMGGALSGIKTLGYRTPKYSARKAMTGADDTAAALFADPAEWGNIRNTIAFGTDEDAKEMLADVLGSDAFSAEQKAAVMNYASKAEAYKGVMMAEQKRRGENSGSAEVDVETSYDNGQSLETPQEKNDARNMYDMQRERLAGIVDEDFLQQFDEDPLEALNDVMTRDDFTEEERQAALDYVNAKATYDGMIDKVRDDIDSQVAASDAMIDGRTYRAEGDKKGMIIPATMKMDDRQVYVIDGDIQMMDDGSMVDVSKSSETIIIKDAETGKLDFASPHDVLNLGQAVSAEQEKATAREAIMQQVAQEQSAIIEGVLPFNAGDVYELADENGQTVQVTVVQDNGDGNVTVTMNGQNVPMPKDQVQAMSDAANMKRLADYQQQKNGGADNEPAADATGTVAGTQQRNYAQNDEVVLRDADGNGVRGTITDDPNGDGLFGVQTAVPILGKKVHDLWSKEELDAAIMEHQGEDVAQPVAEGAETAEGVQNSGENVINGGENVQQTGENVQTEAMPMVGEGENAEPDFMAVTPERGFAYLFGESGLDESDAAAFLNNNVAASAKDVEKIKGKKPKMGTSIAKFNKETADWQNKLNEAEAKAEYWKQMKALRDGVVAEQKAEAKAQQDAAIDQARAEEAAYAAEQAQKAAEQAELGSNNVAPAIREKWAAAPKTEGVADEIVLANGEKVAGKYYLVESGAASASHDANNGFVKTEGFPVDENGNSVNDRDYERDQDAQRVTRQIADNYDSRALQTPVVVSQDGVVLSGNGRTMAGELAASNNTDGAYVDYLKNYGQRWGFTSEQVGGMQHPRVVFVPDAAMPYTAETFAKFNQQEMKGQNKTEQAVKLGKVVDDATFGRIIDAIDRFETLGEFYADNKAATEAIGELQKSGAISQAQVAEMFDGDGVSAIGRDIIENMLVGKAFEGNPDAVRQISEFKSMRQSVIKALPEILANVRLGSDYSLETEIAGAIDLVYKARKEGGYKEGQRVSGFARQMNLGFFGDAETVADYNNTMMLLLADHLNSGFETRLKVALRSYNTQAQESAAGQLDLFSGEVRSKVDILNDVNNLLNNDTEQTNDTRAEGVAETGLAGQGFDGSNEGEQVKPVGNGVFGDIYDQFKGKVKEALNFLLSHKSGDLLGVFHRDEIGDIDLVWGDNKKGFKHIIDEHINVLLPDFKDEEDAINRIEDIINNGTIVKEGDGKATFEKDGYKVVVSKNIEGKKKNWVLTAFDSMNGKGKKKEKPTSNTSTVTPSAASEGRAVTSEDGVSGREDSNKIANGQNETVKNAETTAIEDKTEGADNKIAQERAAQIEAGNYKKGHVKVDGYDITIENPKGSVRSGKDADGKEWSVTMNNTYGYIRGTEGVDGDHIDVFLSDNPEQGNVYVVDQVDADGNFDEHKVMYGFGSAEEARDNYLANYSEGWKMGTITEVSKEEFKKWIESSHRKTKPFSEYKSVKKEGAQGEEALDPRYTPGWDGDYAKWKKRQDYYDEIERKEKAAADEGRVAYYFSDTDSYGQRNGTFHKVWLKPENIQRDEYNNPRYKGLFLWTQQEAWHSEEGFQQGHIFYDEQELAKKGWVKDDEENKPGKAAEAPQPRYVVTPTTYTTAKGKELQMQKLVINGLDKKQITAANKLAKERKGWWSREDGGFLMRSEEDAKWLADAVLGNEEAVEDAQPASLADVQKAADVVEEKPSEKPAVKEFHGGEQVWSKRHNENKHILMAHRVTMADGASFVQSYNFTDGTSATALEVEDPHAEQKQEPKTETKTSEPKRLVSDARMEELKEMLRKKLRGQLNMGVPPEVLAMGVELAVGKIERGMTKFADYAKSMIEDLGDLAKPYLKAFYNAVRDMPEAEEYADQMDSYEYVRKFDVANMGNADVNAMATAEMVMNEQKVQEDTEKILKQTTETRNNERHETEKQIAASTEAVASEAETVASEAESVAESGDEAAINEQVSKIDEELEKVNAQLALLGYYEADTSDPSKFHESYGYMKTAEKKAVADADKLAKAIAASLGVELGRKKVAQANIAPIGGDVYIRIPLTDTKSLYINILLENEDDNLRMTHVYHRIEEKKADDKYWNSIGHANNFIEKNATLEDVISDIKRVVKSEAAEFEIKPLETNATTEKTVKKVNEKGTAKKKNVPLQADTLMGDLFADLMDGEVVSTTTTINNNNNEQQLERDREGVRTEGLPANSNQQAEQTGRVRQETGQASERADRGGEAGRTGGLGSELQSTRGLAGQLKKKTELTPLKPEERKNTNNNHAERGKDYAPKGVEARIDANIKAIEVMQELMENGQKATPEQMAVLRQYSGWGGLGKAFTDATMSKRLRDLLGDEAYEQANMSRNSAYYTPAAVIDAMWDVAKAMGFQGGNVLEGSAGIGNIIGAMPMDMSDRSNIHAVEIDGTTGNILSLLYPDAHVEVQGFEATRVPNGSVDLAITNVPFVTGLHVMDTTGDKDLSKKFRDIHDFCIAKNIRKLRDGGIGIFISSSGTMDNSKKLRDWIVSDGNADVVGAFRLNNETFGGTGATSDIIVVRKRVNGVKSANAIDVSTTTAERSTEYDTGETKKVKGQMQPVVKQLAMDYNRYFVEHPENMGGRMMFGFENNDTFRPTSRALYPEKGKNQGELLNKWVKGFENMAEETSATEQATVATDAVYEELGAGVKEGSMLLDKDGRICVAQFGKAVPLSLNDNKIKGKTKKQCFEAYSAIKEALADVLKYQTENDSDAGLKPLLAKLNKAFDDFVKNFGHLHKNNQIAWLKNDVDWSSIMALETTKDKVDSYGKVTQEYGKTDIFKQRVVEKDKAPEPKNVKDGIIASIYQYGRVNVPYIAEKLGKTEAEVRDEIIESGLGFENPVNMQLEVSYEYLSGNVREKLQQAMDANEGGKYDANVKALEKVVPMDIPAHLIDFTLGSSWVDHKLYEDYVKDRTDVDVTLTNAGGTWIMKTPYYVNNEKNRSAGVYSEMLRKTVFGHQLIEAAIQNKSITVSETHKKWDGTTETTTDKEATQACAARIDEIRQDFKDWARQKMQTDSEMSAKMERIYNDQFNNFVPVSVPDEFVPEYFGGASHKFKMRPHQAKAIVRGTMQPVLLAHEVGTGKTFTLISTAMEMRRLGTARKPMVVVQNATVGQFVASAKALYPNAKVLTLEEKDHTGEGRKNFYAKIKYNDWDMIVVPQSVFERIPDSEERQMAFIEDKIQEKLMALEAMREADPDSWVTKAAEREIEQLEAERAQVGSVAADKRKSKDEKKEAVTRQNAEVKAREMLDRATDDVENFDDMGIDAILVDEAHEYKHLGFATAMQRGVKGVDPSYSKKAQGVYLKAQAVLEKNNGRNVIFATGTPISNTAAEIWTFMRYLMPADTMKDYGIYYFDDFVRNFGNLHTMLEFTTSGKFKENNRFAGYVNLPELVRIWSSVSDTVLTREAGGVSDKIPDMETGKAQDIYLPQTRALRSVMKFVKAELNRYENMTGKEKKENSAIPLKMYGIAKAAAVDARLVLEDAEDDPNSKTNEAVRRTVAALKKTAKYNGTVALFADNYQNKHSGFNIYEDIREKLIKEGVPADQIVVMKSGMSVKKKLEIFDKVNRGDVRVIMGSTFTLGTGVNIQERLHTLIHLDAPNRPMDYTQRNGRILRQGNLHKEMGLTVSVLRFGVEDSLDVTAYQRLKTKGAIADSIMNGKQMMSNSMENRALEEEEDVFGDTVAQLSGSEYAMLKNQAEKDVRKYEAKRKQWEADQTYIHNAIPRLEEQIVTAQQQAADNRRYAKLIDEGFKGEKNPTITIGKQTFADLEAMGEYFKEYNKKLKEDETAMRESHMAEQRTRKAEVKVGNFTFDVKTTLKAEVKQEGVMLVTTVRRKTTYSCDELGLDDVAASGGYLKNAIEEILEMAQVGGARRLSAAERNDETVKRLKGELEQVKAREGKPFEYEKELEAAHEHYDEYSELMKQEMEEKEKKYAEMDSEVDAATNVDSADEDDEDSSDDTNVRFREEETVTPMSTADDKDLRYSLREERAPKKTRTAYAVFVVKQHNDGTVSLHPKMLADEAVGAPPLTWLNADTGTIKRDKDGEPMQNTRGRVSVRDAKGAPLAWRPGKHLAEYPNASQFVSKKSGKIGSDVVFFEVEYAADRDYQLEAWEYGVNENGKYEHSQAGLPYIPKDGFYKYRTNANPKIPAMIITGAYKIKRALTDAEAKKLNVAAGGEWFDREGEPMTAARLKALGLDEAGLEQKAANFDYDKLEEPHDESSVAMSMPGYVRRDLNFDDPNLQKAIKENGQDADTYKYIYEKQRADERERQATEFADGHVLPITNDGWDYQIEGLTMPAYRSKEALLNAFQEKYAGYAAGLTADGKGIKVYAWHKMLAGMRKDAVKKRRNATSNSQQPSTAAEKKQAAYVERKTRIAIDMVNAKAEKLGLNVEVKTDTEGLTGRRARAKGWYDTTTGKITIILPNHTDGTDVMRTLMHEGVAHHGLRQMFGKDFDTFLDNVYANASEEVRKRIAELASRKGWDFHVATEEYLAALAEDIDFERKVDQTWWQKVKFFFIDMLRKAGIVLDDKLTDNDLRYIVWKSYERMAYAGEYGAIRDARTEVMKQSLGVGNYAQTANNTETLGDVTKQVADGSVLLYRDGDRMDQRDHAIVSGRYEREMQNSMYQFREAMQDSMLSLKKLMEYVAEDTGEKVKDYENAYMAENALSSKNHAEQELYGKMLFNPMLDEVHRLAKEPGAAGSEAEGRDGVTRYMMAKHGLERQKLMEARAYQAGEDSDRDFAGLTGLFETDDLADAISQAEQLVSDFEGAHDVTDLWARVNACTKSTLEKTYKSGLLSKEGYETISKMYDYYIPLRGFDATTSDQVYDYLTRERSSFNNPLKKAEGRSSVANDPLATIANMADSAIVQGNKNLMKQKFLKFVMNHPTDVASVNRMWLKKNDITDTWEAVTAQLDENDTPEEILQKTEAFEEQMEQLAQNDPDHYKRGKDAANIPFRTLGKDMDEHMVHVKMGGQNYVITINGNPRVAQALNGLTNPDNDSAGAIGAILKAGEYVNRQMSAFYTTRNPEFVLSNFLRDAIYSNSTMWVRETPNYALKFNKNFVKYNPKQIYQLLQKHNAGTLDMSVPVEKAFYDFMMNGGETGYTVVKDIEKQKKLIKKYMGGKDAKIPVGKAWDLLGEKLDEMNRAVENCARFAAFLTSREMGRTVERSVMDAKEVSVNFNKKGAGSKFLGKQGQGKWYSLGNVGAMTSGVGRSFYVFWNAAVQGTTNFGRLHKNHTAKALAMDAGLFLLGAVLAGMGSGDDDEYYNLPSYVRRSNICFKMPFFDSYITIPLGIEQRAIYGLGELFSSVASGRERLSGLEIAKEIAAAMSSLMPVDMMEGNGELSGSALVPSYVKPIVEASVNKDWKGMPIYKDTPWNKEDPEYTKASKRTNKMLVNMAEALNEWTGGDDVKKGWVDINPAQVEHVLEGTFGGVSTMLNKLVKIGQMATGQQDFDLRNVPMVSRVVKSTDNDAEARRINTEYYKYYNEYKETKRLVTHYENQEDEGVLGMAEKLDFMYNSPEYGRYEIVDEYYDQVKDLTDKLKETVEPDERQMLEEEITDLKREMIEAVRAYDDARNNR